MRIIQADVKMTIKVNFILTPMVESPWCCSKLFWWLMQIGVKSDWGYHASAIKGWSNEDRMDNNAKLIKNKDRSKEKCWKTGIRSYQYQSWGVFQHPFNIAAWLPKSQLPCSSPLFFLTPSESKYLCDQEADSATDTSFSPRNPP